MRAASAAAARAIAAHERLAAATRGRYVQCENKALGGVDDNSRAVSGDGRTEHECHGAGARHAQAGGNGEAAALGLRLCDVAGGGGGVRERGTGL